MTTNSYMTKEDLKVVTRKTYVSSLNDTFKYKTLNGDILLYRICFNPDNFNIKQWCKSIIYEKINLKKN